MKTKILVAAMALAGLMTVGTAVQAQSINVSVIGKITPAACVPVLAGAGVVDYGSIAATTLNMSTFNVLAAKSVAFTITCTAATKIAISAVDNRTASLVAGVLSPINAAYTDKSNFGLGTVTGANVGGYAMTLKQDGFTIDGVASKTLTSLDKGVTWGVTGVSGVQQSPIVSSWGLTAAAGPVAGKLFAGTLNIQAVLNKGSALPLTADVPLDGSATLSIVYL